VGRKKPADIVVNEDSDKLDHSISKIRIFADYPKRESLSDAHTIGRVVLDDKMNPVELVKILCDTGALSANYVASDLIKRLESKLNNKRFFKTKCRVTLADNRTTKSIDRGVRLNLVLKDSKANKYAYSGDFFILDMENNDIIVGLPALTGKLYPFLQTLLARANSNYVEKCETREKNEIHHIDVQKEDIQSKPMYPWTKKKDDIAQEDAETEHPVNFGDALEFLGKSREEAIKEYEELIKIRVSKELQEETDIMDFLMTEALPAFVPTEWTGINGLVPLKLEWLDTLPKRMKPKSRPINPKLWDCSEKEFRRMCGYFYQASRSPWASCLVVAPKATPPYIRFCGDYVLINKEMKVGNYTIPNVKHELSKIINFPMYLDIDLTNAFHQIPLDPETSARLSIQTPWGQFEPKFMPEGIAPATGILQETVKSIFADFEDWAIIIFDNMLILCTDAQDAIKKLKIVVRRCRERNLILKMSKSWFGFRLVEFFGYTCQHKCFEVSKAKKEALNSIEFPTNTKKARSLLGKGVFFSSFVPNYSSLTGHLTDMTKKTFSWNESTWKHDYRSEFRTFIQGLQNACELFYPDYTLDWTLRTDASELGVGAVLLQKKLLEEDKFVLQPIAFVAKKFSDPATRWSTIEQEGYGIFYAVKTLAYYLVGKVFTVETDHNNLLWMEASEVPKIVRWRIFLQSFNFKLLHIAGKQNIIADWFSREFPQETREEVLASIYESLEEEDISDEEYAGAQAYYQWMHALYSEVYDSNEKEERKEYKTEDTKAYSKEEMLEVVHNGNVGHMGARVTWTRLNKQFPGHKVSFQTVQEFVAACANCNKTRLGMKDVLPPIIRSLKPPKSRTAIGIDAVEITPHGEDGHTHINVVVNLFTKLVSFYPVKGVTAINLANSCWKHWSSYGPTDMIISDQGPDLTSGLFDQLTEYMGMRHIFSIADKHANGVERTIGEIVRHLRAKVYDASVRGENLDVFKDPSWLDSVAYTLNSEVNSETGYTPFTLTFGSDASKYIRMGSGELADKPHARLAKLDADLFKLESDSKRMQDKLVATRKEKGISAEEQNLFQPGDFVLFENGPKVTPKMTHRFLGPYLVKGQVANDVTCQHMASGEVKKYDIAKLKLYAGTREAAELMARRDQDQHVIERFLSHTGDPFTRTSMTFKVKFMDGDVMEVPYSPDLFKTIAYEEYCDSKPYLRHLKFTAEESKTFIREKGKNSITGYTVEQEVYLDIRFYGGIWFDRLDLPDSDTTTYVSKFRITTCSRKRLDMTNSLTGETCACKAYDIYCFLHTNFDDSNMIVIDEEFLVKYPQIAQE